MQTPYQGTAGCSENVTAQCTLLQQLSQDLLDKAPAQFNGGCDSSDCLLCQGQRQFCNQALNSSVCAWLGRRQSSSTDWVCSSRLSAAPQHSAAAQVEQQQTRPTQLQDRQREDDYSQCKRLRLSPANTPACTPAGSTGTPSADLSTAVPAHSLRASLSRAGVQQALQHMHFQRDLQQHPQEQVCMGGPAAAQQEHASPACMRSTVLQHSSSSTWQWQREFAALAGPAPAKFTEVASLQSAADASAGHCAGRCDRVSGLEFSPDGQSLAAAGVSKQIGLYSLVSLAELCDAAAEAPQPAAGCLSSSSSSQRQQRTQQQQLPPVLPPMATLRLPAKVSSIAFSPDMQGVISIGDYDGTLTQVHVASGHYLNEVDAHAGRRIWSVCHSKLRHHFAVTASDDCTARLWSGSGLNTHVATLRAPGKPAICCADFSSSNEYLLALAAADAKVYLYDMRQLQQPIMTLHGHRRPVSYAKFFGRQQLVSASIDGTLAVWDLGQVAGAASELASAASVAVGAAGDASLGPSPASSTCGSSDGSCWQQQQAVGSAAVEGRCSSPGGSGCCTDSMPTAGAATELSQHQQQQQQQQPWKVFQGHRNEKNFVGLSVDPCSGLVAVGSETSEVFSYHTSWSSPLARFDMAQQQRQDIASGLQQQMQQGVAASWLPHGAIAQQQSVSAVAWQPSCAAASLQGYCHGGGMFAASTLLAAASSTGVCKLLSLQHP